MNSLSCPLPGPIPAWTEKGEQTGSPTSGNLAFCTYSTLTEPMHSPKTVAQKTEKRIDGAEIPYNRSIPLLDHASQDDDDVDDARFDKAFGSYFQLVALRLHATPVHVLRSTDKARQLTGRQTPAHTPHSKSAGYFCQTNSDVKFAGWNPLFRAARTHHTMGEMRYYINVSPFYCERGRRSQLSEQSVRNSSWSKAL
ncbi:putative disease resistance protein At3g14460-like protein [Anopheles sinensis]|uniref:Putative disease resistance protein At3g14460-like protein n=1 Tax=Anopheles sinensis TaxID=74873 RepID=A0A084VS16_ANOSI|nr:putative disease resistance protein At3g14460-like protein [Anopheles sinensis]